MKKYLLGTLTMLALCMCLLTVPVSAATVASGTCGGKGDGSNLTWFLYDGGKLTIFGMGAMANWSHISDVPWSAYINDIKTVEFRDSVTTIGGWAFSGCASLTNVELPASVTTIGDYAFFSCDDLTSVELGVSVTTIGDYVFSGCANLTGVELPTNVTTIGGSAFEGCSSLTEATFKGSAPSFGTDVFLGVTANSYYPSNDATWTESVRQNYGGKLTWIEKEINHTVASGTCGGEGDGSNLTWVFTDDGTLTISGAGAMANWSHISDVPWSAYINDITTVEIGDSVTTIGDNAFNFCTSLTSVKIGDSVISIGGWAFNGCVSLTEVIFEGSAISFGRDVFRGITANCYYPSDDATWTESVKQNYGGTLTWIEMGTSASYDALTSAVTLHTLPADTEVIYIAAYDDGKLISIISGTLGSDNFIPRAVQADEIKVFYLGNSCQPVAGDYRIDLS